MVQRRFRPLGRFHIEAEDFKESGPWTIALLHTSLRGEASGVELELSTAAFHQFRGGRIVLDRVYLDRDEGLQAFALGVGDVAGERGGCAPGH